MTQLEFIITYSVSGVAMFVAGYIYGHQRARTEADKIRRWWFNRQNKQ
jgi:hypothetical protein